MTINSSLLWTTFLSFILFETVCGVFFPSIAILRARYAYPTSCYLLLIQFWNRTIQNEYRSTIMNLFRLPLNLIVLVVLLADWSVSTTFQVCLFLILVAICTHHLYTYQRDVQTLREKSILQDA